jgi:hypothetical protein
MIWDVEELPEKVSLFALIPDMGGKSGIRAIIHEDLGFQ